MKRTSQKAQRLSASLLKQGYRDVTPRRLERWCADGLGAAPGASLGKELAHFQQLASISSSGRDSDLTARRLAARGYVCTRLRPALLRELGIPETPSPPALGLLDLSSGPSGDRGFAVVEGLASWMTSDTAGLPPLMVRIVNALRRNVARRADELGEPAEVIFQSFVINALCHLLRGGYYNGTSIEAVLNLEPGDVTAETLDEINDTLRITPHAFENSYRSVPLQEIGEGGPSHRRERSDHSRPSRCDRC